MRTPMREALLCCHSLRERSQSRFSASSCCLSLHAQNNYEIQVYGSDTVAPGRTMVELHSNFTFEGSKSVVDGVLPDEHQLHETVEITQGWNDWFETGFYIFTSYGPGQGYKWVGDHIRPSRPRAGQVALAGGSEPVDRVRL